MTLEQQYKKTAKEMSRITSLYNSLNREIQRLENKQTRVYAIIDMLKDYGYKPRTKRDCFMICGQLREQMLDLKRKWNQLYYEIKNG